MAIIPELDSPSAKLLNESRIMRIARGSGRTIREAMEMLEEFKRLAKVWSKMKKLPNMNAMGRNNNAQNIGKVIPPQMLKQFGKLLPQQTINTIIFIRSFSDKSLNPSVLISGL